MITVLVDWEEHGWQWGAVRRCQATKSMGLGGAVQRMQGALSWAGRASLSLLLQLQA